MAASPIPTRGSTGRHKSAPDVILSTENRGIRCESLGSAGDTVTFIFRSLDLPAVINTSSHDLVGDFFVPLLSRARRYDRGVGYFSSGWLRVNGQSHQWNIEVQTFGRQTYDD